jgi:rSAM/selenodomain-associated transferase 1
MKDTVIVFARAPRLGTVKRRLARELGDRAALAFHLGALRTLLRRLRADRRFRTVLALTPDRTQAPELRRVARYDQGHGDLGARMARAAARFRRGRVAIVGSDIPDVTAADLRGAFRALGRADAAFGPADDGGYWLVAMGPRRPGRPFANVRWSSEHALADTRANWAHRPTTLLRMLRDVDTADDLRALAGRAVTAPPA